jgi:DNA primase
LTEDQMAVLWKIVPEPVLCFDGDSAGRRAAFRALERALPLVEPQRSLRFAFLPEGLDPDDLIRRDGAGAMEKVIAAAKPLSEVFWEKSIDGADLSTPERRAGLQAAVLSAISDIGDTTVRDFYRSEFRDRLFRLFNPGREPGRSGGGTPRDFRQTNARPGGSRSWQPPKPSLRPTSRTTGRPADNPLDVFGNPSSLTRSAAARRAKADTEPSTGSQLEEVAIALLARHPGIALRDYEAVETLRFEAPAHERLRLELLHLAAAHEVLDPDAVEVHLMRTGFRDILDGVRRAAHVVAHRQTRAEAQPEDVAQAWRETLMLLRKRGDLRTTVRAARAAALASDSPEAQSALTEAESALAATEDDQGGGFP